MRAKLISLFLCALMSLLGGCAMFHGWFGVGGGSNGGGSTVGGNAGASISVPLGGGGGGGH